MKLRNAMFASVGAAAIAVSAPIATPAAADPIPAAGSYSDLLEPVPDAMSRLQIHDEMAGSALPQLQTVQYWQGGDRDRWQGGDRDHHHHHNRNVRDGRWYRSHGYYWNGGGWIFRRPVDHHHHHQNNYDNGRGRGGWR